MAENKTQPTKANVEEFILSIEDETKRDDSFELIKIMTEITGADPVLWGQSILGFGSYTYKYPTGRTGDWMLVGFSPRKTSLTVYIMDGFDKYDEMLAKLGKHKTGKSCLYIKKLADIDMAVLRSMIEHSVAYHKNQ